MAAAAVLSPVGGMKTFMLSCLHEQWPRGSSLEECLWAV